MPRSAIPAASSTPRLPAGEIGIERRQLPLALDQEERHEDADRDEQPQDDVDPHGERQGIARPSLAVPSLYSPDDLAAVLLERYRKVTPVSDFQSSISEAIEAAHLGIFHAAVSTLLPVVEGIFRQIAKVRGVPISDRGIHKALVAEIDPLISRDRADGIKCARSPRPSASSAR
jgi:hypothetical protein